MPAKVFGGMFRCRSTIGFVRSAEPRSRLEIISQKKPFAVRLMQKIFAFYFFAIIASLQTDRHKKVLCHFFPQKSGWFFFLGLSQRALSFRRISVTTILKTGFFSQCSDKSLRYRYRSDGIMRCQPMLIQTSLFIIWPTFKIDFFRGGSFYSSGSMTLCLIYC